MAKASIILIDTDDGGMMFEYHCDPPLPENVNSPDDISQAQIVLAYTLAFMQNIVDFETEES